MYTPYEIAKITIETGIKKVRKRFFEKVILGFVGGAMISLGYLLDIRVISSISHEWGSLASFIGAAVFPVGLMIILLAGGELITGNMMVVAMSYFSKKISLIALLNNWSVITLTNFIGALFVAYFFGHFLGLTNTGEYLTETLYLAAAKINTSPMQAFFSGIGCNWFVCLAVWLCYGAKDAAGKILGIWFPVMTFVAIGFQHSVANMFIIPAAIFEGEFTWWHFIQNVVPVYLGNVMGGAIFVGYIYYVIYAKDDKIN